MNLLYTIIALIIAAFWVNVWIKYVKMKRAKRDFKEIEKEQNRLN